MLIIVVVVVIIVIVVVVVIIAIIFVVIIVIIILYSSSLRLTPYHVLLLLQVLVFDDLRSQTTFLNSNKDFFNVLGISRTTMMSTEKSIMKGAVTKAKRKLLLDKFFRAVFKRVSTVAICYHCTDTGLVCLAFLVFLAISVSI